MGKEEGGSLGIPTGPSSWTLGPLKSYSRAISVGSYSVGHRQALESKSILYRSPEPRVAPTKVWAKGVSSSEMNVTWDSVQQDMNGILLGYEVSTGLGLQG